MRELSLHILDIAQNSIKAKADTLRVAIIEDTKKDELIIKIKDDGIGMDKETTKQVVSPFYTTRMTRKVGLGIPMLKASAEACDGYFKINSEVGHGTEIVVKFRHSHIDRVPIGNISETITTIIMGKPDMDLIYTHCYNDNKFCLNTKDIKKTLCEVPIQSLDVIIWLKEYIYENIEEIKKG